jgi:hypothetical protein
MMEEDKILFDAADVNGDGKLDVVEFLSFSHPEEDPKMVAPGNRKFFNILHFQISTIK